MAIVNIKKLLRKNKINIDYSCVYFTKRCHNVFDYDNKQINC